MKKLCAAGLCLVLALMMLGGCAKTPVAAGGDLTGAWEHTARLEDLAAAVSTEQIVKIIPYFGLGDTEATLRFEFSEDGTYRVSILDAQKLHDRLWDNLVAGTKRLFTENAAKMGITLERILEQRGMTLEDLTEKLFSAEAIEAMFSANGSYETAEERLFLSDSEDGEVNKGYYINYTAAGDTLTFTEIVGAEGKYQVLQQMIRSFLPMEFTRAR